MSLTKRQQEIVDFIEEYCESNGYPPTVRDIGKAVGLASSSTVHAHLANLEKAGVIRRDPTKPRAIELRDRVRGQSVRRDGGQRDGDRPFGAQQEDWRSGERGDSVRFGLPLVGQVAAGSPILAEENIEEYVVTPALAGGEDGDYLLRVRGESMKNAGILDGDIVVVHPQQTAQDGQIVVAMLEEEATVKRFFREGDRVRLQPENETMSPIYARDVQIAGRVVGLMRSL